MSVRWSQVPRTWSSEDRAIRVDACLPEVFGCRVQAKRKKPGVGLAYLLTAWSRRGAGSQDEGGREPQWLLIRSSPPASAGCLPQGCRNIVGPGLVAQNAINKLALRACLTPEPWRGENGHAAGEAAC